jgi:hypothetical protein
MAPTPKKLAIGRQAGGQQPAEIGPAPVDVSGAISLRRAAKKTTLDLPLWIVIRKSTEALQFNRYSGFMDLVLCGKTMQDVMKELQLNGLPLNPVDQAEEQQIFTDGESDNTKLVNSRYLPFTDTDAYRYLKVATEAFLVANCGVWFDWLQNGSLDRTDLDSLNGDIGVEPRLISGDLNRLWNAYTGQANGSPNPMVPYLALITSKLPDVNIISDPSGNGYPELFQSCMGILKSKLTNPCLIELIWSYWHEQGMLVQTMNAITRRFQNIRGAADRDPLAMLEIDPLRPLNNLLWGYIQDEQHRLSIVRRAYEYDHHYGLMLEGKAVPQLRPADSRAKFLEMFHNLLYLCMNFYKEDDDTTVIADGFPVLNALQDLHMLLAEGAHNQFGDLPATARIEMLMLEWLLARPEFREYLPTRIMVAYPEPWMDRVDAMKKLQGWTDTNVFHFRNLGVFGEQILLSIRYGAWSEVNDPDDAAIWARYWRGEIQGYIYAYFTVTGVDLTTDITNQDQARLRATQPSALIRQRLQRGAAVPSLPAGMQTKATAIQRFRERKEARRS